MSVNHKSRVLWVFPQHIMILILWSLWVYNKENPLQERSHLLEDFIMYRCDDEVTVTESERVQGM